MSLLMEKLSQSGNEKADDDFGSFGLVSDFEYLQEWTFKEDKANLCERIFLHERMLGMWDPEDSSKLVCVEVPLPAELEECLAKLTKDKKATQALEKHKAEERNTLCG